MITIIDTETTDLIKPAGNLIAAQPHIVEFYGIQINPEDESVAAEFHTYIKSPAKSVESAFKTHHLTQEFLADKPTFAEVYELIADVFFGSHTVIGHNLTFDMWMIIFELTRIDKQYKFPYPPIWFCTVEQSMHIKGYRLKLSELYQIATGKELFDSHQAKNDAMATYECYKWLKSGD